MEIKFSNVGFNYDESLSNNYRVLNGINYIFKSSCVYGIVGKSGSGKTTFLKLIDGLVIPSEGKIMVGKFKIQSNAKLRNAKLLRSNIAFVFQNPEEQVSCSTVREEIQSGLKRYNVKLGIIDKQTSDALKLVGLNDSFLERNPLSLSHSELKKVIIAASLAYNPSVIIFDEPTVGFNDADKNMLIKIIRNLKLRYKKIVIVSSSDSDFLLKIADEILILNDGKLYFSGDKYKVLSNDLILNNCGVKVPDILEFSNLVKVKKNINIGYRDDISDLMKDIFRYCK